MGLKIPETIKNTSSDSGFKALPEIKLQEIIK
jgi:hypothetical protein